MFVSERGRTRHMTSNSEAAPGIKKVIYGEESKKPVDDTKSDGPVFTEEDASELDVPVKVERKVVSSLTFSSTTKTCLEI